MNWLLRQLRNKFVAGLLAAVPLVIVIVAALWVEEHTRPISTTLLGFHFPGLGVLVALAGVFLLGLLVTSVLGKWFLYLLDRVLEHVPGFHILYHSWKDVLVMRPGQANTFSHVVLVPNPEGKGAQFGFTSGVAIPGDPNTWCVFLPNIPNPLSGRLLLFPKECCIPVKLNVAEAFKFLLSTGNYLPANLEGLSAQEEQSSQAPQQMS
jgi:uncharacterized membrane protein